MEKANQVHQEAKIKKEKNQFCKIRQYCTPVPPYCVTGTKTSSSKHCIVLTQKMDSFQWLNQD